MSSNRRLIELDAIRGLAAVFVLLYHYCYRYYELYPINGLPIQEFQFGHYGVQAFFIVSGFVIFMTLQNTTKSIDFIVYRFIRLFPTFWICVVLTFLIVSLFSLQGREVTMVDALLNLSMVHTQFGIKSVDGVYWTLLYELKFYFLMFLLFQFKLLKLIDIILAVIMLVILLVNLFNIEIPILNKLLREVFISAYFSLFISGIMFYKIFEGKESLMVYLNLFLALIVSIHLDKYDNWMMICAIYIMFLFLSIHKLSAIALKPFVFFGIISYPLYLIHQNIGYIVLNTSSKYYDSMFIPTILAFTISVFLASIITYIFEKRIIRYLKVEYNKMGFHVR